MRSNRHIELQNMITRWIVNRSFKRIVLPECSSVGYLADFVAVAGLYDSFHTKYTQFSGLKKKEIINHWTSNAMEHEEVGDVSRWYVCVFEVKVTHEDFLNTFGKRKTSHAKARMKPVGTAHWVVADKTVCVPEELPDFWGLLIPYGNGLKELKIPKLNILKREEIHAIAFDMFWLQTNFRRGLFRQMIDMAKAFKIVHEAIVKEKPKAELLRRSNLALKTCRNLG